MSAQTFHIRSIRDAGHILKAHAVSDTTPVSVILDMNEVDHFSAQVIWTDTVAAHATVYTSDSYNPNPTDPQNEAVALNAGTWTDRTDAFTADFTDPAGSAGNGEIHGTFVEAAFVKITLTPSAGAGNVDIYASGKSVR
jgi:hypothetical protein